MEVDLTKEYEFVKVKLSRLDIENIMFNPKNRNSIFLMNFEK
jgi:hypothetical protein